MSEWIIESKLAPPATPPGALVARERLVHTLDLALERRAAVMHAPAGFGKTSLLTHWHETLIDRGIAVAWLSLDDGDRDLFQFLSYLMEALRCGGLISADQTLAPPSGVSGVSSGAQVGAVLTELARFAARGVLILDDFHRAESEENCQAVNLLISRLPSGVNIVLSAREYPTSLSLADLRARNDLVEIDHGALQFTEGEIRDWLGSLLEDSAPQAWAQELLDRTEGWPIALNTVRRWLSEGMPQRETLDQLSGRSSDLSDYFLEQVFNDLDEAEQWFLLKTSILERVNGHLANLLCEADGGWPMLEDLERRDLFVHRLDRERNWYRYHRLFAEFLHERLRRRADSDPPRLHRVASGWFQRQGFVTEAIQHALSSGDPKTVAKLFESLGGWHHALKGHFAALARGLSIVDDALLEQYPRLWLGKIFLTVRRGETEQAQCMLERLDAAWTDAGAEDDEIASELTIMRSLVNRYADRDSTRGELEQLERLSASLRPDNDLMHAVRLNLLCMMHAQRGDFEACMAEGDKAIQHFRAMGSVFGETFIYFHEGYACMAQGRVRDAEELYGAGRDLAVEHFGEQSDLAAIAGAFLAETAYEQNNIVEAKRLIDAALPHIERFDAWLEVYVAAYTTAMKLARLSRHGQSSADLRDRARATAANRRLPRLSAIVDLQEHELKLLEQNGRGSRNGGFEELLRSTGGTGEPLALRRLRISVLARSRMRSGDIGGASALLVDACRESRQRGLMRSYVSYSVLLALARWEEGAHERAVDAFEAALAPSLFEGVKRPFIDQGEALVRVIGDFAGASERWRGNRLRDRFLAELTMEIGAESAGEEAGVGDLTRREREVLRHLVQGRSNREIAEAVPISVNTVKFHLKNIYGKLGVATRKDAVTESLRRRHWQGVER